MAYPIVTAPYGLKPINLVGGRPYSGSTRMVPIVNGYGTSLYNGDVVQLGASGANIGNLITSTLAYNTTTAVAGTVGVFVGAEYSTTGGPIYGKNRYQYWQSGTSAPDAVGYVIDDPQVLFRTAVVQGGSAQSQTILYASPAFVGANVFYSGVGGTSTTGDSTAGVALATTAYSQASGTAVAPITSGAPFRIVQLVPDSAVTVAQTATTSSTTITLSSTNSGIWPGMVVSGPGINPGSNTWVTAVNSTAVTINQAVTTTQSTNAVFSFTGYPEVVVGWNFGFHGYLNATGV